jgi:hypothetical protein
MFDIIVTPVTNKFQVLMNLYAQLKNYLHNNENTLTFINNGSKDGLHQRSFHTHDRIFYIGSKNRTKELILLNHALMRRNPVYTDNQYVVFLQPNTEIDENYFHDLTSAIKSNPDADVILGRVDHKVKNKIKKDARIQKWQEFEEKRNSGALLKNFPPVREKTQKNDEKATDPHIFTHPDKNQTETEIPEQKVSADFSSRSEEPSKRKNFQRAESISSAHVASDKIGAPVTESVSDENCRAIFSDKICQCASCVKIFNSEGNDTLKNFNINKFTIKKFYNYNNICVKKDTLFKCGLFDIDYSFGQSCELMIYKLINLFHSAIIYSSDFKVIQTGKIKKHRSNDRAINNINNFNFMYKNYIDRNVYSIQNFKEKVIVGHGVAQDNIIARSINALVILGSQHNEELTKLVEQQLSFSDKLVVTELPDNCSKKIQEICAVNSVEQYDLCVIVNPATKFRYPHFIDDFKRYSAMLDYNGVLVSNRDFDVREITPGLAAESDVSACFNQWNVFAPKVREASTLSEMLQKCSEMIDATGRGLVAAFLPKPIGKVPVMISERGEGGEVVKETPVKHKDSWYDWMEG